MQKIAIWTAMVAGALLMIGSVSGVVLCDSFATGEHVSVIGDYTGTSQNVSACDYSASSLNTRLMGRDVMYAHSLAASGNEINQITDVSFTGIYSDSMLKEQYIGCNTGGGGCADTGCFSSDEDTNRTGIRAVFSTNAMSQGISIKTMGSTGFTGFTGQGFATGNGKVSFSASTIENAWAGSVFSEYTYNQRTITSGRNITTGMNFDWAR